MTDLDANLNGEYTRWRGKPKASCFVLECIFNPLLFIALIWAAFDLFFYTMIRKVPSGEMGGLFKGFLGVFLLIHMMPVWIYLGGVIFSFLRQRNIEYAITDRGIYFCSGVLSKEVVFKPFAEISNVSMTRGMIDRMTGCGDVNIICGGLGICVLIFGVLVALGMIGNVPQNKAVVLFLLGGIIVLWAWLSNRRHR